MRKTSSSVKNFFQQLKTKIESNHHLWVKLCLSALIPLMIGVFTVVSTIIQQNASYEQRQQDKVDARLLRQQSDQHAGNLQRETALANYLTDISRLFISDNQTTILTHVRTKTLTTLRQLDAERKKHLFLFLYENELLHRSVRALQWAGADFNGIAFRATADTRCSFLRVQLVDVYLSEASFDGCYLDYSNLSDSTMLRTAFLQSLLMRSSFQSTLLDKSRFIGSKLVNISFFGASLIESNFTGSVWEKESVDLTNSNLREAILSDEQLRNSTLLNCLLPNGTWSRMQTTNLLVNADLDKNCLAENGSNLTGWNLSNDGQVKIFERKNETRECYFRVTNFPVPRKAISISQTFELSKFTLLIGMGIARYNASVTFQCFGQQYATVELRFTDRYGLRNRGISKGTQSGIHRQTLTLLGVIPDDIRRVQLLISFINLHGSNDGDDHFCACFRAQLLIEKSKGDE